MCGVDDTMAFMKKQLETTFYFFKQYVSLETLRFVISGGTVALTELSLLYVFTDVFHIWYLFSLIIAFSCSFVLSFLLQKFWTFKNKATDKVHFQAVVYLLVALMNLVLNACLLYILVQFVGVWYLLAQAVISAVIAIWSFLIYKFLIFKKNTSDV